MINAAIVGLGKAGLVARRRSESDRRSVYVLATPAGRVLRRYWQPAALVDELRRDGHFADAQPRAQRGHHVQHTHVRVDTSAAPMRSR